jgi:hypothetical protein
MSDGVTPSRTKPVQGLLARVSAATPRIFHASAASPCDEPDAVPIRMCRPRTFRRDHPTMRGSRVNQAVTLT